MVESLLMHRSKTSLQLSLQCKVPEMNKGWNLNCDKEMYRLYILCMVNNITHDVLLPQQSYGISGISNGSIHQRVYGNVLGK